MVIEIDLVVSGEEEVFGAVHLATLHLLLLGLLDESVPQLTVAELHNDGLGRSGRFGRYSVDCLYVLLEVQFDTNLLTKFTYHLLQIFLCLFRNVSDLDITPSRILLQIIHSDGQ
uniref:Uncharacterized protein n=1 Tax=Cacopsylla melanoneura TaxID=428564 RepID=A0A8D8TG50_9HEMI